MRLIATFVVACALVLSGCKGPTPPKVSVPAVKIDTPAMRTFKSKAGIETCVPGPGPGSPAAHLPDLTLPCLGGGPSVDLASLRGPMIINIWGSWCGPCRKELPVLGAFAKKYDGRVQVVGIDYVDQFPVAALQELAADHVTYPQLVDQDGAIIRQPSLRLAQAVPQSIFVAPDGTVVGTVAQAFTTMSALRSASVKYLGVGA